MMLRYLVCVALLILLVAASFLVSLWSILEWWGLS